jgi:hypothetical protein
MSGQKANRSPEIDHYCTFNKAKRESKDRGSEKLTARELGSLAAKHEISNERYKEEKVYPPWMCEESKVFHTVLSCRIISAKQAITDVPRVCPRIKSCPGAI